MLSLESSLSSRDEYRSVTRTNFLPPASWYLTAPATEIRASLPMKPDERLLDSRPGPEDRTVRFWANSCSEMRPCSLSFRARSKSSFSFSSSNCLSLSVRSFIVWDSWPPSPGAGTGRARKRTVINKTPAMTERVFTSLGLPAADCGRHSSRIRLFSRLTPVSLSRWKSERL